MTFPNDKLNDELIIYGRAAVNGYGDAIFAAVTTEKWHLEPGYKLVTDRQGEEVVASLFGIGPCDSVLSIGDEVEWNNRRYRVIDVQPIRYGGATHHVEAYFGGVAI